jgi:LysR family hydrogen peroxide-inducible transcriptional activator
MTITQLKYVLAVAEHKNFTLAAEKCFVTQPTLSMQIQKIEEELSILIFDRSKNQFSSLISDRKLSIKPKTLSMKLDGSRTLSNSKRICRR